MKKGIVLALVALFLFWTTGFFVIQPIGAVPDGATIWYWRHDLNTPFIASADGMLLEAGRGINLLGRGMVLGKMAELLKDREITRFPYLPPLYLYTTGGKEYAK